MEQKKKPHVLTNRAYIPAKSFFKYLPFANPLGKDMNHAEVHIPNLEGHFDKMSCYKHTTVVDGEK